MVRGIAILYQKGGSLCYPRDIVPGFVCLSKSLWGVLVCFDALRRFFALTEQGCN